MFVLKWNLKRSNIIIKKIIKGLKVDSFLIK